MIGDWSLISQERLTSWPKVWRERTKGQICRNRRENIVRGVCIRLVTNHNLKYFLFVIWCQLCIQIVDLQWPSRRLMVRHMKPEISWPVLLMVTTRRTCGVALMVEARSPPVQVQWLYWKVNSAWTVQQLSTPTQTVQRGHFSATVPVVSINKIPCYHVRTTRCRCKFWRGSNFSGIPRFSLLSN